MTGGPGLRRAATAAAPGVFVGLWSTGFVGARYGLPYAGPFTFLALRLGLAGVLLSVLAALTRAALPRSRVDYVRAAVAGILLHAGYLGGVFFAISAGLPAGVAAVVVSLQPVLTAALATRLLAERLLPVQWAGLAAGLGGVVLVLAPGLSGAAGSSGSLPPEGVAASVAALLAGTAGTLWQKRHGDAIPLLSGTAVQYAAAALVLVVAAGATESMAITWTPDFLAALAWLVLALSLGAVLLLLWLLRRGSAAGVSSLFFLVPPATALEAYALFGEELPGWSLLGVVVTTIGVAVVLRPPGRRSPRRATMGA